jgi:hypothetical protein
VAGLPPLFCECQAIVGEKTRIVNRMRVLLIQLGICGIKPELRWASQNLNGQRPPKMNKPISQT